MSYDNPWYYENEILESDHITDYVGMVYLLENTTNGKLYVGKKFFWTTKTRSIKGKRKKVKVESDWKKYYGSCTSLHKDIEIIGFDKIHRTVLHLCRSKTQCSYYELKEQVDRNVLLSEGYYNEFIGCKVNGKHLKDINE